MGSAYFKIYDKVLGYQVTHVNLNRIASESLISIKAFLNLIHFNLMKFSVERKNYLKTSDLRQKNWSTVFSRGNKVTWITLILEISSGFFWLLSFFLNFSWLAQLR